METEPVAVPRRAPPGPNDKIKDQSAARVWATASERTLARRLRRKARLQLGQSRAEAVAVRCKAFRLALLGHWSPRDKLGAHTSTFGEASLQPGSWKRASTTTLISLPSGIGGSMPLRLVPSLLVMTKGNARDHPGDFPREPLCLL